MSGRREVNRGEVSGSRGQKRVQPAGRETAVRRRRIALVAVGGVLLLALVAIFWPSAGGQTAGAPALPTKADRVDVVYFHRTQRCASCLWAGEATAWTINAYFADDLASGRVTFREVDVQNSENGAIVSKYRATGSSLFLNQVAGGEDHITQVSDVFVFTGNRDQFAEMLRSRVNKALGVGG